MFVCAPCGASCKVKESRLCPLNELNFRKPICQHCEKWGLWKLERMTGLCLQQVTARVLHCFWHAQHTLNAKASEAHQNFRHSSARRSLVRSQELIPTWRREWSWTEGRTASTTRSMHTRQAPCEWGRSLFEQRFLVGRLGRFSLCKHSSFGRSFAFKASIKSLRSFLRIAFVSPTCRTKIVAFSRLQILRSGM